MLQLEEYKEYVGITNPNQDTALQSMVDYSNALISRYCGAKFGTTETKDSERHVAYGNTEIVLDEYPAIAVSEVLIDGEPSTEFYLDENTSTVVFDSPVRGSVRVTYTYGYAEYPLDVKLAAMELVTHINKKEYMQSINISGESANFNVGRGIPPRIKAVLDLYRHA
jgi:hypothetical protein